MKGFVIGVVIIVVLGLTTWAYVRSPTPREIVVASVAAEQAAQPVAGFKEVAPGSELRYPVARGGVDFWIMAGCLDVEIFSTVYPVIRDRVCTDNKMADFVSASLIVFKNPGGSPPAMVKIKDRR